MVHTPKQYPDESININAGPIRGFGESYQQIVEDLIDTMKAYELDSLSAIEIGYPYQIMVLKEGDQYKPYANPRIITQKDSFESTEQCHYFHDIPITVNRYKELSIIYEDENGQMHTKKIEDAQEAARFQRTLDFLFNTSMIDRLKPHQREQAVKALAGKGHMPDLSDTFCPTESKKEYFVSVADKLLFFMFISLLLPLFGISKETLSSWYTFDKFAFPAIVLIMIGFFLYAQYEAKQFKQCTSCQVGNNIGVMIKRMALGLVLATASYFILG